MRTENYFNSIFEATMNFEEFLKLCTDLCDGKIERWGKRNPDVGLSIANFRGWQPWVDDGFDGELTITCRYRHLTAGSKVQNSKVYHWDAEEIELNRIDYLRDYGFHRVKR